MSRRNTKTQPKYKQIRRERDPLPWKYCFLTVVCGLILLAGFFGAARQHFVSIEYGIENSKLRKQIDELETERRNLINARETALAPKEILKAAKKYGFTDTVQQAIKYIPTSDTVKSVTENNPIKKITDEFSDKDSKTKSDKKDDKKEEKKSDKSTKDADAKNKKETPKKSASDEKSKTGTAKK